MATTEPRCEQQGKKSDQVRALRQMASNTHRTTLLNRGSQKASAIHWWELSMMRQVEVYSRLRRPAPRPLLLRGAGGRHIDRPEQVELAFTSKHERRGRPRTQPLTFKTKIVTRGTEATVNAFYKNSRIKQYLNCDARSHAVSGYADWGFSRC